MSTPHFTKNAVEIDPQRATLFYVSAKEHFEKMQDSEAWEKDSEAQTMEIRKNTRSWRTNSRVLLQ